MPDRSGTVLNEIFTTRNRNKGLYFTETTTKRGFGKLLFSDYYNKKCSLQMSSVSSDECVWLGIEDAEPRILTTDAIRLGVIKDKDAPRNPFGDPCGWIEYPVPQEVSFTTRMHLTREQAKQLALQLLKFALCGTIK